MEFCNIDDIDVFEQPERSHIDIFRVPESRSRVIKITKNIFKKIELVKIFTLVIILFKKDGKDFKKS